MGVLYRFWWASAHHEPERRLPHGPVDLVRRGDRGRRWRAAGYAVALLVYLLNRGKYHPLVRAAIVTSALGYTLGGLSVLIDIGRWWNFYKIPLGYQNWNFNSILLEVALCIMLYTWCSGSRSRRRSWRSGRSGDGVAEAVRGGGVAEGRAGHAVPDRPRAGAPDHAPVVAGQPHAAGGRQAAPALAHAAPAGCSSWCPASPWGTRR
jgi:hypothetical protein